MRQALFMWGLIVMVGGCTPQFMTSSSRCPGQANTADALALLQQQADKVTPLRAYGQCRLGYPDQEGHLKESAPIRVTLWMDPPHNIYMQGFAGMGSQGKVEMGSNPDIFWVGVKPELDEFLWGRWAETHNHDDLQINPRAVMEALGVLDIGAPESWRLSGKKGFDVLTQFSREHKILRRVFMDRCDYVAHRIEYFDRSEEISLVVELAQYTSLANGFKVPGEIAISTLHNGQGTHWVRLSLDPIKSRTFTDSQRQRFFHFDESKLQGYGKITDLTE